MMKLALVLALASWFHRASWERMGNPLFLIPPLIAVLVPVGLILKEPNLGTAVITALVGAAVFFAAGVRWWKFLLVAAPVPFLAPFVYAHLHDYQRARIETFLHPESGPARCRLQHHPVEDRAGVRRDVGQGIPAGHPGAPGFPAGEADRFHLHHDRRGVRTGGRAGGAGLLCLIVLGGMLIALRCRHQFGRLVALGIAMNFFMYVFVNIAMVMGVIPVGGVPLPLVSHGGSAMFTVMIGFGHPDVGACAPRCGVRPGARGIVMAAIWY